MLKNFYIFICLFLLSGLHAQTNTQILYSNDLQVPDVLNYCPGENFSLKVNAVATSTGDYTMQAAPSFSINNGSQFVPFSDKNGNNRFSLPINLGFTFDFYGTKYSQVVVGSNGRLVFSNSPELANLNDYTKYIDRIHSGNLPTSTNVKIPSPEYNKVSVASPNSTFNLAQIFAGYTDIGYYTTNDYNKITYGNVIYNGKKGLLISFTRIIELTSNYTSFITSQVLLLEDNHYFIKVLQKTKNTQNAIIGAQNETGDSAVWPVNNSPTSVYNNGLWNVTTAPIAYEFIPSQNLTPKVEWFQNGSATAVQTGNTINFSPINDSDQLDVKISFLNSSGDQVGATKTSYVTFNQIKKVNISEPVLGSGCAASSEIHVISPDPNLSYDWFNSANPTTPFATNTTTVSVSTGSYYAKAKSTSGNYCGQSDTKVVTAIPAIPAFLNDGKTLRFCDNLGTTSSTFNLLTVSGYSLGTTYSVEFLENGSVIANPTLGYNITLTSGTPRTFTIRVTGTAGCTVNGTFTVSYLSLPPNGKVYNADKLCFEIINYTTAEFKNKFFPTINYDIKFSTDGINYNLNSVNPKLYSSVQVKIKHPDFTCESIGTLNFSYQPEVTANTPNPNDPNLQQCASDTQTYNLPSLFNSQVNPSSNVTITYYNSLADAQSGNNAIQNPSAFRSGMGYTTLYIRVVDNTTGCVAQTFPSVTLLVYLKPRLEVQNPIVKTNCAGNTIFDLTQNISALTNAQAPTIVQAEYYSENNVLLTPAEISNYDASVNGTKPYIKLTYNSTCGDILRFDLRYNPKPTSLINQIPICGEKSYSLADFKAKVVANPANYTFTESSGNALPNTFTWSTLPYTVNYYITDNSTGCKSDLLMLNFVAGNPTAVKTTTTDLSGCDTDFDGKISFNLDSQKTVFTNDTSTNFKYFKDSALTQSISSNYTNETAFNQTVYAQVTSAGFCPTVVQINLKVNVPTKSTTLQDKYLICFGEQVWVDAGTENVSWEWSNGGNSQTKIFTAAGSYSVKLTNANGCSYTHNFVISAENQPVIEQINQTNEKIEVIASGGVQPYEYSFDGGSTWQTSNILTNPTLPEYHIQVRSTVSPGYYCLGGMKSIYTITVNNVITPNGDGYNDYWTIANLDKMENVQIVITDRYGKSVFNTADKNNLLWDGKIQGRPLPTASYWYVVKWFDSSTNKNEIRNGWILLKNRD